MRKATVVDRTYGVLVIHLRSSPWILRFAQKDKMTTNG